MGVEDDLQAIIGGKHVSVMHGIDVKSQQDNNFVPITKVNMCYICGAVLFDEKGNVLLIQEAKKSCRGFWYLPLGRLEPGETIIDGAKREVMEESGLECDLTTLLSVEINGHTWIRFTFTGKITGGSLKTLESQDAESLQAKFFSKEEIEKSRSSLRMGDILKLIDLGRKYWEAEQSSRIPCTLPVISPHSSLIHRVVIVDQYHEGGDSLNVLANTQTESHIPTALMSHSREASIAVSVFAVIRDAFTSNFNSATLRMCGILGVEHRGTGKQEDGICITSLVSLDLSPGTPPPALSLSKYQWYQIRNPDVVKRLGEGIQGKILPLL